jgi:hypothetical protein
MCPRRKVRGRSDPKPHTGRALSKRLLPETCVFPTDQDTLTFDLARHVAWIVQGTHRARDALLKGRIV